MNKKGKWLSMAFALALGMQTTGLSIQAEDYTYTVRIHAGNHGSIDGREEILVKNLPYNTQFTFHAQDVQLDPDSKYYVKGIKESGKDNDTAQMRASFPVKEDMDLVVSYGMRSNTTQYMIHYVDEDGNTLAPSVTYTGNVGDRPVVAYLYIEGYQPQAYNITGTLKEEGNDWRFVYQPVPAGTTTVLPGETTIIDQTTTITSPATTTPATPGTTTPPAATPPAAEEGTTPAPAPGPGEAEEGTDNPNTPQEIIDIDDPDVPLAGPEGEKNEQASSNWFSWPVIAGFGALALVIAGGIAYFLVRKRREEEK